MYHNFAFPVLQVLRDNRFSKLFNGTRTDGTETAHRALDEKMELIQHKYKSMSFKNDVASWVAHSFNMPLSQQCTTFVENIYSRRAGVEAMDELNEGTIADGNANDVGNRKKRTTPTK